MLRTYQFRSDQWSASMQVSSGGTVWTNTKDASPISMMVPMTTLVVDVRSAASVTSFGSLPVRQTLEHAPLAREAASLTPPPPPVQQPPSEPHRAAVAMPDRPEPTHRPVKPEARQHDILALMIEALPHWRLIEPISVTVASSDDQNFTGTIYDLDMTATAASPNHVLLILKEKIETLYEELGGKSKLDATQKKYLGFLRFHISTPLFPSKRPRF